MMAKTAMTVAAISTAKPSASRTAVRLKTSATIVDAIAGTPGRVDQVVGERPINLGAQPRNVSLDDAGLGIEMEVRDALEQHRPGHDAPLVAHEKLEQPELARLQVDRLAGAANRAAYEVHFEIRDTQQGLFPFERRTASKGMKPRQKL